MKLIKLKAISMIIIGLFLINGIPLMVEESNATMLEPNSLEFYTLWSQPLPATYDPHYGIDTGDINGDGIDDIAVLTGYYNQKGSHSLIIFDNKGNELWSKSIHREGTADVKVADIDGDGKGEVILHIDQATNPSKKVTTRAYDDNGDFLWEKVNNEQNGGPLGVLNMDRDPEIEIVAFCCGWASHNVSGFDGDGTVTWTYNANWPNQQIYLSDLTGDDYKEIIFGASNGADKGIIVLDTDGNLLWKYYANWYGLSYCGQHVRSGDITEDDINDIVVISANQESTVANVLYALDNLGTLLWSVPFTRTFDDLATMHVLIDVSDDGNKDVILTVENKVKAFDNNGILLWEIDCIGDLLRHMPLVLYDIDLDGEDEIIFEKESIIYEVLKSGSNFIPLGTLLNNGSIFQKFSERAPSCDVDNDGYDELIVKENIGEQWFISLVKPIIDYTPPEISVIDDPIILWPPNHKYHTISVSDFVLDVYDENDIDVDIDNIIIMNVSSDEPEKSNGDGNTVDDIVIIDNQTLMLRSERKGNSDGRVYTINFKVADFFENTAHESFQICVPKSKKSDAIDSGFENGYIVYN